MPLVTRALHIVSSLSEFEYENFEKQCYGLNLKYSPRFMLKVWFPADGGPGKGIGSGMF